MAIEGNNMAIEVEADIVKGNNERAEMLSAQLQKSNELAAAIFAGGGIPTMTTNAPNGAAASATIEAARRPLLELANGNNRDANHIMDGMGNLTSEGGDGVVNPPGGEEKAE